MNWPSAAAGRHLGLSELPLRVVALLDSAQASARLVAHLLLVHATAVQLTKSMRATWPDLEFDGEAVLFGAATHDIGKARVVHELTSIGKHHEVVGHELLLEAGVDARWARFSRTHGLPVESQELSFEDVLVMAADTLWKGKRDEGIDERIVAFVSAQTGQPPWRVFASWDALATQLCEGSEGRLAWQQRFPAR
jgi:putative nucleotidyltransferase with HDIG domain